MEGLTVLNQTLHEGSIIEPYFTIGIISLVVGIVLTFCSLIISGKVWKWISVSTTCLAVFGMVLCLIIGVFAPREQITRYKVLIDDNVRLIALTNNIKL